MGNYCGFKGIPRCLMKYRSTRQNVNDSSRNQNFSLHKLPDMTDVALASRCRKQKQKNIKDIKTITAVLFHSVRNSNRTLFFPSLSYLTDPACFPLWDDWSDHWLSQLCKQQCPRKKSALMESCCPYNHLLLFLFPETDSGLSQKKPRWDNSKCMRDTLVLSEDTDNYL